MVGYCYARRDKEMTHMARHAIDTQGAVQYDDK